MKLVCMLAQIMTPNQIRSMPNALAAGAKSGIMMKAISKKSRKNAMTKIKNIDEDEEADNTARQGCQHTFEYQ